MGNSRKRLHIKSVKSDDTQTIFKFRNKSTFLGFKSYGNFDCLALRNQTITFEKQIF